MHLLFTVLGLTHYLCNLHFSIHLYLLCTVITDHNFSVSTDDLTPTVSLFVIFCFGWALIAIKCVRI